jgi:hypothetical protein
MVSFLKVFTEPKFLESYIFNSAQFQMLTSKTDNSKFDREALSKFHSVVARPGIEEVRRLLRHYYAGSTLTLQMDLQPLLNLDVDEVCRVFEAPFRTDFNGKSTMISRLMDKLIDLVSP